VVLNFIKSAISEQNFLFISINERNALLSTWSKKNFLGQNIKYIGKKIHSTSPQNRLQRITETRSTPSSGQNYGGQIFNSSITARIYDKIFNQLIVVDKN
jgi:hypothetical protein